MLTVLLAVCGRCVPYSPPTLTYTHTPSHARPVSGRKGADVFDDFDESSSIGFREAVVSAIVRIHRSVGSIAERLGRRTGRRTFVSPRDYLDFVHHFKALYETKRRELEDQQLHLNIGLDKLGETQREVMLLQAGLSVKEKELVAKNKEANEKLVRMLADQKDAEQNKAVRRRAWVLPRRVCLSG